MEKNAIIAAVLSIAVIVGWQYFVIRPMEEKEALKQKAAKERTAKQKKSRPPASQPLAVAPPAAPAAKKPPSSKPPPVAAAAERRVRVDTGPAVYEFTNRGAGLAGAVLMKYKTEDGKHIDLAKGSRANFRPLFFQGGAAAARLNAAAYRIEGGSLSLTKQNPKGTLRFIYRSTDGLAAEKTLSFQHDSYRIGVGVRVVRPAGKDAMGLALGPDVGGREGDTYGGVIEGPMSLVGKELEYDSPEPGKPVTHRSGVRWTSLQSKHFITALIPRGGAGAAEIREIGKRGDLKEFAVIVPLPNGAKSSAKFDFYVGPKEVARLALLKVNLEDSLDYGIFSFIARPLMTVLRAMYAISGNWGVAIILLTIIVKLVFYPLTHVSMRNMKEMQKLQPRIMQLREIYKDDKNKLNEATMGLYREHKVNPMMGCLPMIVQIPVFFGLYEALLVSIELRSAPFFWWITDLSKQDPFHVFTILMGLSMFIQQKMTPTAGDPTQQKMMMFMPIVFTAMFVYYPVPVGLVIYWFVNNTLSIVQQFFVNRSVKPPKLAEEEG